MNSYTDIPNKVVSIESNLDEVCEICDFMRDIEGFPVCKKEHDTYIRWLEDLTEEHNHTYNSTCRVDSEYEADKYTVRTKLENYQFNIEVRDATKQL